MKPISSVFILVVVSLSLAGLSGCASSGQLYEGPALPAAQESSVDLEGLEGVSVTDAAGHSLIADAAPQAPLRLRPGRYLIAFRSPFAKSAGKTLYLRLDAKAGHTYSGTARVVTVDGSGRPGSGWIHLTDNATGEDTESASDAPPGDAPPR